MSIAASAPRPAPPPSAALRRWPSPWSVPAAVLLGCALVSALTAGKAAAVWTTGVFLNPDDAMRAVEVRDLLAGQGWFDTVQHRLAPGHGAPMHWSRLADLPLAGAIRLLAGPLGADVAERVTRLAQPVALLVLFMVCQARLGRTLLGERGALAACLLAAGGIETVGVFIPGHIHHHALQVTLLLAMAALVVDGVAEPAGRTARFAGAGGLVALTLAINLQNLPFATVAVAALGLGWVLDGAPFAAPLRGFALALLAGTAAVFLLQVPPGRSAAATCDAFGAPHLLAAWVGGAGLLALSAVSRHLPGRLGRAAAGLALAAGVLLAMRAAYPACLGDPYAAVDPELRRRWLAEVSEAMPLVELLRRDPAGTVPVVAALTSGLALVAAAVAREAGASRARWAVVAGLGLAGLAGTLWEVRVAASAEPFAALGAAWALCRWFDPARPRKPLAALLCIVCGLALTQAGWAAALAAAPPSARGGAGPRIDAAACFAPASYAALAGLPAGLVLSTIDPGSQILAYTHHSVLAAPYHRNGYGNLLSLHAFDADPAAARDLMRGAGVRYVALCLTSPEVVEAAARAPDGLAGRLSSGRVPEGLRPVGTGDGPVRLFEVVASSAP